MFTVKTMRNEGSDVPQVSIDQQVDPNGSFISDAADTEKHFPVNTVNTQTVSPVTVKAQSPNEIHESIMNKTPTIEIHDSFQTESTGTHENPYDNVTYTLGINTSIISEDNAFAPFDNVACNSNLAELGAQKFMLIPLSVASSEVDNRSYSNAELQTAVAAIDNPADTVIQQSSLMTGTDPVGTLHPNQIGAGQQMQDLINVHDSQQNLVKAANSKPERKPAAHHLHKVTASEQACKDEILNYLETTKGRRGRPPKSVSRKKNNDTSQNLSLDTGTDEDVGNISNDKLSANVSADNALSEQSDMTESYSIDGTSKSDSISIKGARCSENAQNKSMLCDLPTDKSVQTSDKKIRSETRSSTAQNAVTVNRSDKTKCNESQDEQNVSDVNKCTIQARRSGRKRDASGSLAQESKAGKDLFRSPSKTTTCFEASGSFTPEPKAGNKDKQTSEVNSQSKLRSAKKCRSDSEVKPIDKIRGRSATNTRASKVETDLESRHDFYKMTVFKDKCVVTLAPVTIKTMQQREMVIEVEVSDDLKVVNKSSKSESSSGLSLYTLSVTKPETTTHKSQISSDRKVKPGPKPGTMKATQAVGESDTTHKETVKRKRQEMKGLKKLVSRARKPKTAVIDLNKESAVEGMEVKDDSQDSVAPDAQEDTDNLETVTEQMIMSEQYKIDPLSVITASLGFQSDMDISSTQPKVEPSRTKAADGASVAVGSQVEETALEQPQNTATQGNKRPDPKNYKAPKTYTTRVTEDGSRIYGCPLCGHESRYSQNVTTHYREHSSVKNYVCEECGIAFKTNNRLSKHRVVHRRDRPYACPLCPKAFKSRKVYQCLSCSHTTGNRQNMSVHGIQHTGERPYQCEVCGRTFKGPSNLHAHKRQHTDILRYNCTLCGRSFRDRGTFTQHSRRHTGDKRHVCEHCGKSFVISTDLKKHLRTHTGEKPYQCGVCGKTFADGSGMMRHQKMHTRKTRFECSACLKIFTRKDLCNYHIKKTHGDGGPGGVAVREINIEELSKRVDNDNGSGGGSSNKSKAEVKTKSKASGTTRSKKSYPPKKTWQNFDRLTEEASKRLQGQGGLQGFPHEHLQLADFQSPGMGPGGATMPQFHGLTTSTVHHAEFGSQPPPHYYPDHNPVLPLYPPEPIQNL